MDRSYWLKQDPSKPAFPDLQWSRPENKAQAGRLLIVGGNAYGFAAAAEAYAEAGTAGIGTARVLLPNSLQKTVGRIFDVGEYAPSTKSGSFSQQALAELIAMAAWSDGVLLAGDLGRNSETAILIEKFTEMYTGQLTITKDAADYILTAPGPLLDRENTVLVLAFGQLQKLGIGSRFTRPFTSDMSLLNLIEALHEYTTRYKLHLVVRHNDNLLVAVDGQVSTTKVPAEPKVWRIKTATHAGVWWLQNPGKVYESLTSAVLTFKPFSK